MFCWGKIFNQIILVCYSNKFYKCIFIEVYKDIEYIYLYLKLLVENGKCFKIYIQLEMFSKEF